MMGGIGCYGNSELLKPICSNVQDGRHLEILQTQTVSQVEAKLDGRHWGDM